ncbi:MAG TPA: PilN domain-containing protein [Candidatus Saccharimonadales bacterium]|nr:PilN domain-containing protein [Candidatus Saccharimonadales bacterium]
MSAQLNLLPDVKLQYIRARRQKRLVIGLSAIVSAFFLVLFVGLFIYVRFSQTHYMNALTSDINKTTNELKAKPDLDKILTVQNQLNSLPDLHDKKIISSRLFDYLSQVTPTKATISNVDLDLQGSTLDIKGNADTLGTVNKFADTLKFTDFQASGDNPTSGKAFSDVVLKSFSVNSTGANNGQGNINYELQFSFDPTIFANIKNLDSSTSENEAVKLKIPNIITTRSEIEKPGSLFAPQPNGGIAP